MIIQFNNVFFKNIKTKIVEFKKATKENIEYIVSDVSSDDFLFDDNSPILFDDGNTITT